MAKLKAPLLSLGAAGAIGKSLVFFNWKGLDVVREYVVPSNPQTAAQIAQRAYVTNAVTRIHTAQGRATNPMDEADTSAYALLGRTFATPRTWFNQVVKEMVDAQVASKTYPLYYDGSATPGVDSLVMQMYAHYDAPAAGKFYYGTSISALINSVAATIVGTSISKTISSLTTGIKYYVQFRPNVGDNAEGCNSGIYYGTPT